MKDKLFTIILLHYNQEEFIYESLNSILEQDYSRIELIIADDGSKKFDKKKIEEYIKKNKKDNIEKVVININENNLGTVKTLNKNISQCSGDYVLFFAADDRLETKTTISNFVKSFIEYPESQIITAQCLMYDKNMEKVYYKFVTKQTMNTIKNIDTKKLYDLMTQGCLFAAGATAYKKEIFDCINFDESYKLVEDWSFYLKCTRLGINIKYVNFPALAHRDGGVSHSFNKELSPTAKQYYADIFNIYENEIIPFFSQLSYKAKMKVISDYKYYKNNFSTPDHKYLKKSITYKFYDGLSIINSLIKDYIYKLYTYENLINSLYMILIIIFLWHIKLYTIGKVLFIIYFTPKLIISLSYIIKNYISLFKIFYKRIVKKLKYGNSHFEEEKEEYRR